MKALKKIGFAVFAICMAFTAMSCKDDDDSPSVVTEWISTYEGDTTKSDVTIKINVTKVVESMLGNDSTKLVTYETTGTGTIS